jgi:hydrogenase maturation protease
VPKRSNILVIGIGNPDRGDDAAGRLVARRLAESTPAGVDVVECDGKVTELIELLAQANTALVIDAGEFSGSPGSIRRLDAVREPVPVAAGSSTHGLGLAQAIGLARALNCLPQHCIVYLIQGADWAFGAPLSPAVRRATGTAVTELLCELQATADKAIRRDLHNGGRDPALRSVPRCPDREIGLRHVSECD